ncbi:hypothetical protein PX699_04080 [Sphingobium sp. H39-3-25]|uniref:hypothetical protein n=1 Tax=Sphingobium arseniciresistens TaxID=3030834 RepID=UPI0023B8A63F|nr:hypothetical protein [Sphingobium arseniciresistens]
MDLISDYHAFAEAASIWMGSDTLAHINAGLAIYVVTQTMLRTRRASIMALQVVIAAELCNEVIDRLYFGGWRWDDTIKDVVVTLFWPTVLYTLSRYRRQRWAINQARIAALFKQAVPSSGDVVLNEEDGRVYDLREALERPLRRAHRQAGSREGDIQPGVALNVATPSARRHGSR